METQDKIISMELSELIGERFGDYSKYVISSRAIPDVRDGLKPVQRRILYTMFDEGNGPDKPYRKSARTVGSVMGRFHPHGDSSIYQALVTMAQSFQKKHVLIDGQGNFGSMDDDPAAAMRYTESRLSSIAMELLRDLKKDTVDFVSNFDNTEIQPSVLPARFPNLLVNGVQGIASGFATNIPTHNLGEIIDAAIALIENPQLSTAQIMKFIPGPDFPTGGTVIGKEGIKSAYETGKGSFHIRATYIIEQLKNGKQQLVITELPYQVIKQQLVNTIEEIRMNRRVEGIAEARDETDRNCGPARCRIIVEFKKDADIQSVIGFLLQKTDLQVSFGMNLVAIVGGAPKQLSLGQALLAYIEHQKTVIRRRTQFDLNHAKEREHIVEGFVKALSIIDELIAVIRQSKNRVDASKNLQNTFKFTELQADSILSLQLYRLTNLEINSLQKELSQLKNEIHFYEIILDSEKKLLTVLKNELLEIKQHFSVPRMTTLQEEMDKIQINREVLVTLEEIYVTFSKEGYIKRVPKRSFSRSGGELDSTGVKENDTVEWVVEATTIDHLLFFTAQGYYFRLPIHAIPEFKWKEQGTAIINVIPIDKQDRIVSVILAPKSSESDTAASYFITHFTKHGLCKRTKYSEFETSRTSAILAIGLKNEDLVINACLTTGNSEVMLTTFLGKTLHFIEDEINIIGRSANGVKAIKLDEEDYVVSAENVEAAQRGNYHYIVFSHRGIAKRTPISDYPMQARAGKGNDTIKVYKRNPHRIVGAFLIGSDTHTAKASSITICITSKGRLLQIQDDLLNIQKREDIGVSISDDLLFDEVVAQVIRTKLIEGD